MTRHYISRSARSRTRFHGTPTLLALAMLGAASSALAAEPSRTSVAFSTAEQSMAEEQPEGGAAVSYAVDYAGGAIDGCSGQVAETLYGRDEESWGAIDVGVAISCEDGGFGYEARGSWNGDSFQGGGHTIEGSGTGRFEGYSSPVAFIDGSVKAADGDTWDISFTLLLDPPSE